MNYTIFKLLAASGKNGSTSVHGAVVREASPDVVDHLHQMFEANDRLDELRLELRFALEDISYFRNPR